MWRVGSLQPLVTKGEVLKVFISIDLSTDVVKIELWGFFESNFCLELLELKFYMEW